MYESVMEHWYGGWTMDWHADDRKSGQKPPRRVQPKPVKQPPPPLWGATSSEDGHRQVGQLGLGLCSFAVGVSPEEVKAKVEIYREGIAACTRPIGASVHDEAATFTMALCHEDRAAAHDLARESFEWYPKAGAR